MLLDVFTLRVLALEIGRVAIGSRIASATLSDRHTLLVTFSREIRLVLSAAPEAPVVFLPSADTPLPGVPYFDDRLTGAVVTAVKPDRFDRVITLDLVLTNQLGRETLYSLVAELTGRNSNLILVDADTGRIVHALRRVTGQMSRVRRIVPGIPYSRPPLPERLLPERGTPANLFVERMMTKSPLTVANRLMRVLPGLTQTSCAAILQSALDRGGTLGQRPDGADNLSSFLLDEESCVSIWAAAIDAYADFNPEDAEGYLVTGASGEPIGLTVFGGPAGSEGSAPLGTLAPPVERTDRNVSADATTSAGRCDPDGHSDPDDLRSDDHTDDPRGPLHVPVPSISAAVESLAKEATGRCRENETTGARKTLIRRMAALERKLAMLQADLSDTAQMEVLQQKGHILMANLHKVPSWCTSVELEDFYAGDGRTITVEIDPSISPIENARRYVARARKAKVRQSATAGWVSKTKDEYDRIHSMMERLSCGQAGADEIQRIERREPAGQAGSRARERSERQHAPTPRHYVTTDGWKVLVGRNDHENDRLLTEVALPDDTWLHAQGCPGSHVIVRGEGRRGEISRRTLEEAAALAAFWSKARGARVVPVVYTRAKYVRKSKGAPPGAVTVTHEKTIFVAPRALPIEEGAPS